MYARGILFGKMKYELGDHAQVRCPESGMEVDIEFKVKGWVGGSYNAIGGFIKDRNGKNLFELSGHWNGEMNIKDLSSGKKEVLFDASHAKPSTPKSRPLEEQAPRESQKLWATTTHAIKKADQKTATDEKSRIEDEQRREASERGGEESWQPKLFKHAPSGDEEKLDWIIDATVDAKASPEKQVEQILAIAPILPGQTAGSDWGAKESAPSQNISSASGSQGQQQQTQHTGTQQAQQQRPAGNDDLIDFGQHDGAKTEQSMPVEPVKSSPGNPIRRTDSTGNEEVFADAEM